MGRGCGGRRGGAPGPRGVGPCPRACPSSCGDAPEQVLLLTSSAEGPASAPWPWPSTIRSSSWEVPERDIPTTGQDSDWNCVGRGHSQTEPAWVRPLELCRGPQEPRSRPTLPWAGTHLPRPVSHAVTAYISLPSGKGRWETVSGLKFCSLSPASTPPAAPPRYGQDAVRLSHWLPGPWPGTPPPGAPIASAASSVPPHSLPDVLCPSCASPALTTPPRGTAGGLWAQGLRSTEVQGGAVGGRVVPG